MAARLHQQAMSSYSAMATFVTALEMSPPGRPGAALAMVAARARTDLAEQVDALRDMLAAMAPPLGDGQRRLEAPLRAYVDSLYGDGCRPSLSIEVDESVAPDWTTEMLALRIIHAALDNVHRHSRCRSLQLQRRAPRGQTVVLEVVDDGVGFDRDTVEEAAGPRDHAHAGRLPRRVGGRHEHPRPGHPRARGARRTDPASRAAGPAPRDERRGLRRSVASRSVELR